MVVAAEHNFYSELAERLQGLFRVGQSLAAKESAEAARILETHRRKAGLTPEGLEALERYGRIYERASLILLEHFAYPHAQPPPPEF
jgi:intein/homing endonuclease